MKTRGIIKTPNSASKSNRRISWAEKLESYNDEEPVSTTPKLNGEKKGKKKKRKLADVNIEPSFGDSTFEAELLEEKPFQDGEPVNKKPAKDLPVDAVEDIDQLSDASEEEEIKPVKKEEDEPVSDEEDVPAEKENKSYQKFDFRTARERTVFVGNVPYAAKPAKIKRLFAPYGTIEAIYKRSDLQKNEKHMLKMFGTDKNLKKIIKVAHIYVRYAKEEDAKKAVELNGTKFMNHYLRVTLSTDNATDPKFSLLVGNLPFVATEQSLMDFFVENVGNVKFVRIVHDRETGMGKGYGFVTFKDIDSVLKALTTLQGKRFNGRPLRLSKLIKKKKNRPASKSPSQKKQMNQKGAQQRLKNKLGDFIVAKKTFSSPSDDNKLSKKVVKKIRKRKQGKSSKSLMN